MSRTILLTLACLFFVVGCSSDKGSSSPSSGGTSAEKAVNAAPSVAPDTSQPTADDPIVYVTRTGKKYHAEGCRFLAKSSIPMKLSEAKAKGYGPCSKCNPPQ